MLARSWHASYVCVGRGGIEEANNDSESGLFLGF